MTYMIVFFQESLCGRGVSTCGKFASPSREELEKEQQSVHPYRLVEQELSGITESIKQVSLNILAIFCYEKNTKYMYMDIRND